jgi:biopolymer transport protein ExbD
MRIAFRIFLILTVVLLLALWNSRRLSRRSAGSYVGLPAEFSALDCRDMVLTISKQHSVKINYDAVALESLAARLKSIYSQCYWRVLLVRADPEVSFEEAIGVVDVAHGAVTDMQLVMLTPKTEKTAPSCLLIDGPSTMNRADCT